jgi:hypothetical protein
MNPCCDRCDTQFIPWVKIAAGYIEIYESDTCRTCWSIEYQDVNIMKKRHWEVCGAFTKKTGAVITWPDHCSTCGYHGDKHTEAGTDKPDGKPE